MGITRSNPYGYYDNNGILDDGAYGDYRYIPLSEIIDSFAATYVGKGKLCEGVILNDVTFHAIRGLQELSYDTLKSTKDWEVEVPSSLVLVMPLDYVNYVKVGWSDSNGIERIIYPTSKTSNPFNVEESVGSHGGFTTDGANQDLDRTAVDGDGNFTSDTFVNYKSQTTSDTGSTDSDDLDDEYGNLIGARYGIDPQHAQANGTFFIDEDLGKFHFSSNMSGKTLVLRYISDGLAPTTNANQTLDLTRSMVPKLAEEAIYKHMLYGVLLARKDSPAGLLAQIKKERFAETRKAKLRLSNLKLEELTQILRGGSKMIKH
tara:strand:- start:309 stop:1262 length:954 start_codon:yes stop_codon:yes gene_type:complete